MHHPRRLLNVLCTFHLRPLSRGIIPEQPGLCFFTLRNSISKIIGIKNNQKAERIKNNQKTYLNGFCCFKYCTKKWSFPLRIKCDKICRKLRIWSHLLKKSLTENFIFCAVKLMKVHMLSFVTTPLFKKCVSIKCTYDRVVLTLSWRRSLSLHKQSPYSEFL